MHGGGSKRLAVEGLAVLLHDPPWKPWGIGVAGRIAGCSGEYWSCLAKKVAAKGGKRLTEEAVNAAVGAVEEYRRFKGKVQSHELQGALVLRVLGGELKGRGLAELAECVEEAERLILKRDKAIHEADTAASALDRLLLVKVLGGGGESRGGERPGGCGGGGLLLVNPFNPQLRSVEVPCEVDVDRIAEFIVEYVSRVAEVIMKARRRGCMELLHVAFALLEPLWYTVMGEEYAPPADTRIPTHTVFDHVNAALATLLWRGRVGCIVVVDLAGVQEWISESRRLRDLWAASWLASLLSWKTVEELAFTYGPGVLMQPPARLNPFYAAALVSKLEISGGDVERWLLELLGVEEFPVDPVIPTRLTIALPPEACSRAEKALMSAYENAWSYVAGCVAGLLREACDESGGAAEGVACDALGDMERLPPPLAQRIIRVDISKAFNDAIKIYEKFAPSSLKKRVEKQDFAEATYYTVALLKLVPEAEGERYIAVPARFSTREYLGYARRIHSVRARRSGGLLCTVCGKGYAIVNGSALKQVSRLRAEVGEDRLCPYCLVKRLLRRCLETGTLAPFPGVKLREAAREKLRPGTVDSYTSRTRLAKEALGSAVEALAGCNGLKDALAGLVARGERGAVKLVQAMRAANTFLSAEERSKVAKAVGLGEDAVAELESLVLEASHYDDARRALEEAADAACRGNAETVKRALRAAGGYRRKYSILRLDGDFMGSRVLRGRLGVDTRYYIESVASLEDEEAKRVFAEIVEGLVETLVNGLGREYLDGMTVPPTPSYHFTVSRALAAQAQIDRRIVEMAGGFLVFAGGDDVLAILPPAEWSSLPGCSCRLAKPVALEAAARLRRAYWAADSPVRGFHVVEAGRRPVAVVAALAVYGRSGALLYVDAMHPLWASLKLASSLEESKDEAVTLEPLGKSKREKDVLFVAADSGGLAALPQHLEGYPPTLKGLGRTAGAVKAAALLSLLAGRAEDRAGCVTPLPGSFVADVLVSLERLWTIRSDLEASRLMVLHLLERNLGEGREALLAEALNVYWNRGAGRGVNSAHGLLKLLADEASPEASVDETLFGTLICVGGEAGRLAAASGYTVAACNAEGAVAAQQLFTALVAAAKAFRSAT